MQQSFIYAATPKASGLGRLRLSFQAECLVALEMGVEEPAGDMDSPGMQAAQDWLDAYFAAQPLPMPPCFAPQGTPFQRRVWSALSDIAWGEKVTYAVLAARVGSSARAVGGALRANPLPLFIPCHRVVGAASLGGYAGASALGQQRKRWLLQHEAGLK